MRQNEKSPTVKVWLLDVFFVMFLLASKPDCFLSGVVTVLFFKEL